MASSCAQPRRTAPNTTRSRSAAPARPAGPPSTTSATGIGPREKLTIEGLFEAAVPGPDRVHQMHRDQRFGRGARGHFRGIADDNREQPHAVANALDLMVAQLDVLG